MLQSAESIHGVQPRLPERKEVVVVRSGIGKVTLNGVEVVIVRSGIGKVNAGICTQILVDDYGVDCVINTGIAGSLRNEINIGDIVISTDAVQHDMDVRISDTRSARFRRWVF